jgi:RHS repeat-associated protein
MTGTRQTPDAVVRRRSGSHTGVEGFLAADPRLDKNRWTTRSWRVCGPVRRKLLRGSGGLAYDRRRRPWIGETITNYSSGVVTSVNKTAFVYDGNQIVMQFQKTGTGDLAATDLSHRYLWGAAVDQLLADEQLTPVTGGGYDLTSPGTGVWTLTDNENTVRDLATYSNGTTTVENHREFSAYGELLSQTNPQTGRAAAVDCVFAYTGRALDEATGLQNNDERWYEAITGRWLSQDPSGLGPDVNPFRYCDNGPTNAIDPTGLQQPEPAAKPKPIPPHPVGAPPPLPGEGSGNQPQQGSGNSGNQPQQNSLFPLQIGESGGNFYIRCSGNSDTGTLTVNVGVGQPPQGTGPATSGAPPVVGVQQNTINGTTTIVGGIPIGTGGISARVIDKNGNISSIGGTVYGPLGNIDILHNNAVGKNGKSSTTCTITITTRF